MGGDFAIKLACYPFVFFASLSTVGAADPTHVSDAPLHAVQFVDDREGWAVGATGAIWHTIDSGASWALQPSGVRAPPRSGQIRRPKSHDPNRTAKNRRRRAGFGCACGVTRAPKSSCCLNSATGSWTTRREEAGSGII